MKRLLLLCAFFFLPLWTPLLQAEEKVRSQKVIYSWQEETEPLSLSGTLLSQDDLAHPFILELKVRHPAGSKLSLNTLLTPFFLPSLTLHLLNASSTPAPKEEEETTLRYLLDSWQSSQSLLQADLFCALPIREKEIRYVRLPLQFPNPQISSAGNDLTPPFLLEPLKLAAPSQQMLLSDLETSIQVPSLQRHAEVIREHGVPWGNLALLGTFGILLWGGSGLFKQWQEKQREMRLTKRSPAEEALSQLAELKQRNLIQRKEFAAYYTSLIATLRWYLHARFPDSYEDDSKLPKEVRQLKEDLIAYADPIKFGKQSSTPMDSELAAAYVAQCIHLVEKQNEASSKV